MKWWTTYRLLKEMTARLYWPEDNLHRYRDQRLRELVRYAYASSPFYHQMYNRANVNLDNIKSVKDLTQLPILPKEAFRRADPMQVVTLPDDTPWIIETTSGSTGEPLRIYRTWRDLYYIKAKVIRAFRQTGLHFSHRQVILKSSAESLTGRHWFENFGILRKYWMSVADPPEQNLSRLRRLRPQHLHGFPSGLRPIADILNSRGEYLHIPVICTGAEVLDDLDRSAIEQAFKAQVHDFYASREVGNIAWECRAHNGLHINDDAIILELVDDQGHEVPPGTEGRAVVTWLDGRDWPFIRYDLGDRAVRLSDPCPCGVRFSRLARVEGRSDCRILLPSGVWISGMVFQELRTVPWAAAFRIVQDNPHAIRLQIVLRRQPSSQEMDDFIGHTRRLLRGELQVIPEIIPQLERDPSGKIRAVICRLPEIKDLPRGGSIG
jgi:phenylacetate-CoA ligase